MGAQNRLLPEAREDRMLPEARVQFSTPERVHRLDPWTRREVYPRVSVLCPIDFLKLRKQWESVVFSYWGKGIKGTGFAVLLEF